MWKDERAVARVAPIELQDNERESLRAIIKRSPDWRERDRAETIWLLAAGQSVEAVAEQQGLCREAVRIRRRKWLKFGLASLPDRPRCGAPSKLADAQRQQLGVWVESEALSSRELLTRLEGEYGVVIGRTTLRMELKRLGYVWKRTRYSLKKNGIRSGSSRPEATSKT
jgi:transposase